MIAYDDDNQTADIEPRPGIYTDPLIRAVDRRNAQDRVLADWHADRVARNIAATSAAATGRLLVALVGAAHLLLLAMAVQHGEETLTNAVGFTAAVTSLAVAWMADGAVAENPSRRIGAFTLSAIAVVCALAAYAMWFNSPIIWR